MFNTDHLSHIKSATIRDKRYEDFTHLQAVDMRRMLRSLPMAKHCQHLGKTLTHAEAREHHTELMSLGVKCNSCGERNEYHCSKFGFTNMGKCTSCHDWKPNMQIYSRPPIVWNHDTLCPQIPGDRLNCSIIESGKGYLLLWRQGWGGADLYLVRLDSDFQVTGKPKMLNLTRSGAEFGREDGRLFRVDGKLHVMYVGVEKKFGPVNVLYATVNEKTLEVEKKWYPQIDGRQSWEKNHAYFGYDKKVMSIYSIKPHRVLEVKGNDAQFKHETRARYLWSGGRLSGGASPYYYNSQWYHFFHGSTEWNGRRQYNMGVYTFEATPPFRPSRITPHPIDVADPTVSHDNHCDVIFPGGVIRYGDSWGVAMGVHDRWCELRFYRHDFIESQLEVV